MNKTTHRHERAKRNAVRHRRDCARRMALWALTALLAATGFFGTATGEKPLLKLMIVTDIHYLSPALYEDGRAFFESALKKGDGKMAQFSREILEGLIQEVHHQRPDALIVSGDLSFNGEKASHLELAAAFERLRAEGFPVWVIPGNHDINDPYAGRFTENRHEQVPNVTPGEFREIYRASMGPDHAGKSRMSYTVSPYEHLRLAMCDVCVYDPVPVSGGYYSGETEAWLQEVLEEAQKAGARVITVTHQSMIPHTEFLKASMAIKGGDLMLQQMKSSGISSLNLSGHLHIQHISEAGGVFDIATGAFSIPPFRYGMLTIGESGTISYEAAQLCREHIPQGMADLAETWFEEIVIGKEKPQLQALGITDSEQELMLDYAARLNHAYFAGDFVSTDSQWTEEPAFALWQNIRDRDDFARYLAGLPNSSENAKSSLTLFLAGNDQ